MASEFKFNTGLFSAAVDDLRRGIRDGAEAAMASVIKQATDDARAIKAWREPGEATVEYPGVTWTWEVTGMAAASIQGYVVPNKNLQGQASITTTSYRNGQPLEHPHRTDDSVTGSYSDTPERVIGVVTMNVSYAAYLQDWEMAHGEMPVTVEVFAMNWSRVYVPIAKREVTAHMLTYARKYT